VLAHCERVTMSEVARALDRALGLDAGHLRGADLHIVEVEEAVGPPAQVGADDLAGRVALLYRELFPAVYGFVRFRVGDAHVAEDLTATVFERALSKLASVREPERVRGWLFSIARNAVADERRRRRPSAPLDATDTLEHLWVDSPERHAVDRDEWRRLLTYLAELDDRDREILGLRFAAGLANREIGEILGLTESNVAQIIHRAVVKLRRRFASEEPQA